MISLHGELNSSFLTVQPCGKVLASPLKERKGKGEKLSSYVLHHLIRKMLNVSGFKIFFF